MLKKTITYTDYNNVERKEDFHFNLSKAEIMEMEMGTTGGLSEMYQRIILEDDVPSIIKEFKKLILASYGVKSPDGKQFIKNEELREKFSQTEAYSELFMELATDAKAAADFVNGIMPASNMSDSNMEAAKAAISNGDMDKAKSIIESETK